VQAVLSGNSFNTAAKRGAAVSLLVSTTPEACAAWSLAAILRWRVLMTVRG
jgi:hypothetical protein